MTRTIKAVFVLIGILCVLNTFVFKSDTVRVMAEDETIKAVWVATVFSLDYPQKPSKDVAVLKADIDKMIGDAKGLGYNTIFFQVRPSSDAFYESDIYPWSVYLTGEMGVAPNENFDPLGYAVERAHKEGIALHAWINPYRVTASANDKAKLSVDSIANKYPELVVEHTDGKLYLNPGVPETNQLIEDGVMEIVRNYEVDGIHIDDYFYPGTNFPDSETYTQYGGKFADIGEWRRDNVTTLIRSLHTSIKAEKENVIFSVSPCGIWANRESQSLGSETRGTQAYYEYYADTRLWVKENLLDIMIPQIYWNIGYEIADFTVLANWWNDVAEGTDVKVCIGQAVYKAADETSTECVWYGESGRTELKKQTDILNGLDNVCGYAHYRMGSIKTNNLLQDYAKEVNFYKPSIFDDTDSYPWAKEAIESLYNEGVIKGMGDGSFGCARTVSRADFIVMLMRVLGRENEKFYENFSDVTADKYYYNAIGVAKKLGFTDGRGDNIFDPTGEISRQDMAVMVYRVLKSESLIKPSEPETIEEMFIDAKEISGYAREAVATMSEKGILNGYETGEFKPLGSATRAETAVFMYRIFNMFK